MDVQLVTTPEQRNAVFQFRYRMYVELEGRTQFHANHLERLVREPLDDHAIILAAFEKGEVVGTLRTNLLAEGPLGFYDSLYGIDQLSAHDRQGVSITTKLMVAPRYRGSSCAMRLSKLTYQLSLARGTRMDFIDSRGHTIALFKRLGHRIVRDDLMHPEYGLATLMRLDLLDVQHLQHVRSPFLFTLQSQLVA